MKKILIIVIVVVSLALIGAFVSIFLVINKSKEPTAEEKLAQEIEALQNVDIEELVPFTLDQQIIQLVGTGSKHDYIVLDIVINVRDNDMLARVEKLKPAIIDSIRGLFESKTPDELSGKRQEMKEPILKAVKDLFSKEEDKLKIISVFITNYQFERI